MSVPAAPAGDVVVRGRVVTPQAVLDDGVVRVVDGRVSAVDAPVDGDPPSSDAWVLPGLVDLHCHGGGGASFTSGDPHQVAQVAQHHRAHGTTSLIGSAVTDAPDVMLRVVATLADAVEQGLLAGVHVEGPFLAAARCGAQDPQHLRGPDVTLLRELLAAGRGHVRVVTLAPELPGADDVAQVLDEHGVVAAVGHTEAPADVTRRFLAARPRGRALVTHLFNAMPPVHHRRSGPALAALAAAAAGEAVVELVADGVHVHDDVVTSVLDLAPGGVALVTDAMAAAGMRDGTYSLGPLDVTVRGRKATLAGETTLAGGTARLLDVVRRQVRAGLDPGRVVRAAGQVPADLLGLAAGRLEAGRPADLVVLDGGWSLQRVMVAGRWVG